MINTSLFVMATITPKSQYFEQVKAELLSILEPTRAEPGCLRFDLHESECQTALYLYEEWTDKLDLDAHHQQAYTRQAASKLIDWLAAPTQVSLMHKVD